MQRFEMLGARLLHVRHAAIKTMPTWTVAIYCLGARYCMLHWPLG